MEVRDLPPRKDPKGGSPAAEQPKKPKSDQIRHASIGDYLKAHSHPNGGPYGWQGFIRSNLFAALLIWILSQVLVFGGACFIVYARTNQLVEWRATVDQTMKRMDEWGTTHGHYADERQDATIIELQAKTRSMTELETNIGQLVAAASERNNQQDRQIAEMQVQLSAIIPVLAEIKAKMTFIAELLDERTKNKK